MTQAHRTPLAEIARRGQGSTEASWFVIDRERDMIAVHLTDVDTRRGAVVHVRLA